MKKFLPFIFAFCFLNIAADTQAVRMESDPSLKFLMHLQRMLEDISPPYKLKQVQFQKRMRSILGEARSLQLKWEKKNPNKKMPQMSEEELRDRSQQIISESLDETEDFLTTLLQHLKENRKPLEKSMMNMVKPK